MKKLFTSFFFIGLFTFNFIHGGNAQWVQQPNKANGILHNVQAVDSLYVWVTVGGLINTTDGGANWSGVSYRSGVLELGVFFHDRTTGVVGGLGGLSRTTNGGTSWDTVLSKERGNQWHDFIVNDVFFVKGYCEEVAAGITNAPGGYCFGWAVGTDNGGRITRTTDKGLSWMDADTLRNMSMGPGAVVQLYTVHFTNPKVGYAGGGYYNGAGRLYKTIDSGFTWTRIPLETEGAVSEVYAIDENVCFVAQDQGREITSNGDTIMVGLVTKTTDGGKTWVRCMSLQDNSFKGLRFVDSLYGWVTTAGWSHNTSSSIYRTTDGGTSWAYQDQIAFARSFTGICMLDRNTGWALGYGGGIIKKTTNGGGKGDLIAVRERNGERENLSSISVYPHPVSGKATFSFDLEQQENVRLILSDVLGRTVKIIHEGMLSGGNHEFTVETSDLAAGMYECRFSTPQINTSRIVIVNK